MRTTTTRGRRRPQLVVAMAVVSLVLAGLASPAAGARGDVTPSPDGPTTTVVDPTTTVAPTTVAGPTTTVPGATTTVAGPTSSTSSTSTTLPPEAQDPNFVPAPLVPAANTDPLFHAARLVDADYVALDRLHKAFLPLEKAHRAASVRARDALRQFAVAQGADRAAAAVVDHDATALRGAAMRAYTGFGSDDDPVLVGSYSTDGAVNGTERTYMDVTTGQMKVRLARAATEHRRTLGILEVAYLQHRTADASRLRAVAALAASRAAVRAAQRQLDADTSALDALVAQDPDLAPGTLTKLPKNVKLPKGVQAVDSPAGTIIIPAKADKRTVLAVRFVVKQYGKPYLWGGTGPDMFDCSGLMMRAFEAAGVAAIPRVSQAQQAWATPVDPKDAMPGDLVFFGRPAYHVGMYIGGGLMIDAPFTGAHVRVDRVWAGIFSGFGRVVWPS